MYCYVRQRCVKWMRDVRGVGVRGSEMERHPIPATPRGYLPARRGESDLLPGKEPKPVCVVRLLRRRRCLQNFGKQCSMMDRSAWLGSCKTVPYHQRIESIVFTFANSHDTIVFTRTIPQIVRSFERLCTS